MTHLARGRFVRVRLSLICKVSIRRFFTGVQFLALIEQQRNRFIITRTEA